MSDQPVEVGEAGGGDTEPLLADIVNSFIVNLGSQLVVIRKLRHRSPTMKEQSECSRVVWVVKMEL